MRLVETYRVAIFIPADRVEQLLAAVLQLTELQYGLYAGVSWTSAPGDERFTPLEGASPSTGTIGKQEMVRLSRVEFSLPRDRELLDRIILEAVYPNHEWEEPVISITEALDTCRHPRVQP